jgi:hypothetical protein
MDVQMSSVRDDLIDYYRRYSKYLDLIEPLHVKFWHDFFFFMILDNIY